MFWKKQSGLRKDMLINKISPAEVYELEQNKTVLYILMRKQYIVAKNRQSNFA